MCCFLKFQADKFLFIALKIRYSNLTVLCKYFLSEKGKALKKPNWVSISTSRDDGDIVEAFVRCNSKWIDEFIFLDDSSDSTKNILKRLSKEGYKIEVHDRKKLGMNQVEAMNWAYRNTIESGRADVIAPLDLDEIMIIESMGNKSEISSYSEVVELKWRYFIPIAIDKLQTANYLRNNFRSIPKSLATAKILVPKRCFENSYIGPGNHVLIRTENGNLTSTNFPMLDLNEVWLAHFPIRSAEQIMQKVIIALATVRTKQGRFGDGEGIHLLPLMREIYQYNYNLNLESMQVMAANYGDYEWPHRRYSFLNHDPRRSWDSTSYQNRFDDSHVQIPDHVIKYADLGKINAFLGLGELIEELTVKIASLLSLNDVNYLQYRAE